jgi:hypothetical protein
MLKKKRLKVLSYIILKMEKFYCPCGSIIQKTQMNIFRHERTTKHLKQQNNLWYEIDLKKQKIEKLQKEIDELQKVHDSYYIFKP